MDEDEFACDICDESAEIDNIYVCPSCEQQVCSKCWDKELGCCIECSENKK